MFERSLPCINTFLLPISLSGCQMISPFFYPTLDTIWIYSFATYNLQITCMRPCCHPAEWSCPINKTRGHLCDFSACVPKVLLALYETWRNCMSSGVIRPALYEENIEFCEFCRAKFARKRDLDFAAICSFDCFEMDGGSRLCEMTGGAEMEYCGERWKAWRWRSGIGRKKVGRKQETGGASWVRLKWSLNQQTDCKC